MKKTETAGASSAPGSEPRNLAEFQQRAAKYNSLIAVPQFETTPDQVRQSVDNAIKTANAAMDAIGKLSPAAVTFENTVLALDDLGYAANTVGNRIYLIKETSQDAAVRDAATDAIKKIQEWAVGLEYREDVYRAVKALEAKKPKLQGEDEKLLKETLRDYRRAGLHLPKSERDEVERLRKELSNLSTDFQSNVTKAQKAVKFTAADLEGVPDSLLQQIKTGDNEYTVMANVTFQFQTVMENAKKESTRKLLKTERFNLARTENVPLLEKILVPRSDIAQRLGYKTWADYITEVRMAKNGETALNFLQDLKTGLQPKFDAEIAQFQKMKARDTGDANAKIYIWDWRYYANQLKKERYTVDAEQLRVYFPYQRVLEGMFAIYQQIFELKFTPVEPPYKWVNDLQLYAVSDSKTGEPMGLFYLDMFPREGKFNHFAQFGITEGKRLRSGEYQRPTVALVCNFPTPAPGKPSLLSHADVETLFHEFGHAMHSILTRANHARFAGTSVPRDFVEAPSQMLEHWIWDKKVLDSFAADYRDPSKKIPADILAKLREAKLATEGTFYRRQLSFGILDLTLHTRINKDNASQVVPISNKVLEDVFLPLPPDTAFVAYFGHLMGYDASYYGYAWADAISSDMATVFKKSPDRFYDAKAGRRLRDEIYAPGDSRDVNISIRKFLGRERSIEPFLEDIGITKK
jgi:thimet oligopeptidase